MKRVATRQRMEKYLTSAQLRSDVKEWNYRWKNGMRGHKLYFGLVFFNKKEVETAKKILRSK